MTHVNPVSAFCPIDEAGVLQPQFLQHFRHDIMLPAGKDWRIIRVIVEAMDDYDARAEVLHAVAELPDCVACALLGVDEDAPMEGVP